MDALLSCEYQMTDLISRFQEYLEYDDVRFFSLYYLSKLLKDKTDQVTECYATVKIQRKYIKKERMLIVGSMTYEAFETMFQNVIRLK